MRDLFPYLQDVVHILASIDAEATFTEGPDTDERDNYLGGLTFTLRFHDRSELHVDLWADCSGDEVYWPSYSFHYQDNRRRLRFRYDNAPHHAELPNFPHHLHLARGRPRAEGPPTVRQVARRIEHFLRGRVNDVP